MKKTCITPRNVGIYLFTALLLCLAPICAWAQDENENAQTEFTDSVNRLAPDFVTASICLADPTDWRDDLMGELGHAFIRLQCPTFALDYCFSYESESSNDNIIRLLQGDLKMGLFAAPTDEYLSFYRKCNRAVHEYELNLPSEAELRLWEIMDNHISGGLRLPLDLGKHGCTQTLVEYVTQALDTTQIHYDEWGEEYRLTRQEILDREMHNYPWLNLFVSLVMRSNLEGACPPEQKIILPRQLPEVWQKATVCGTPLLTYKGDIVEAPAPPSAQRPLFTPLVALCLFILLMAGAIILIVTRKRSK